MLGTWHGIGSAKRRQTGLSDDRNRCRKCLAGIKIGEWLFINHHG